MSQPITQPRDDMDIKEDEMSYEEWFDLYGEYELEVADPQEHEEH